MGLIREYLDFQSDRDRVYESLTTGARGTAVAVERELELRVSSLETLALSPALTSPDLGQFDAQALAFLSRLPAGTSLGIVNPAYQITRRFGPPEPGPEPRREALAGWHQVFDTREPLVTNLRVADRDADDAQVKDPVPMRASTDARFSVDVPVFQNGRVIYDLFLSMPPSAMAELIARQRLQPRTVLTVVDGAGVVVARLPNGDRFVGLPIVPALWAAIQINAEGLLNVPTLEGIPAVAAYAHVAPFSWTVIVGAPEEVIFAPTRAAIIRIGELGAAGLIAACVLAMFAARGISRPIERLRWLALHDGRADTTRFSTTGLRETDMVARALMIAASGRREAARELAESEERFRALFEKSPSGMILLDPDTTRVIDCNAAAAGFVGYSRDELRGTPIDTFVPKTSLHRMRKIFRVIASGQSASFETQVTGRLGSRDMLIALAPAQLFGRTLVLINQIDLTDLRRAEAGLRVHQERLELAREGANLGIWDWDLETRTLSWSEHQWRLHGLEPRSDGPTDEEWQGSVHPADLQRTQQELVAALKSPEYQYATEYNVNLPDGSVRRLLGRGQTIRGANGRAVRMVGINMDVTARYEAEMARDRLIWMLETERSRLSEIVEALPVGVGIVDRDGRVILGNAMINRLTGPVMPMPGGSITDVPVRGDWIGHDADGNHLSQDDYPIWRALRLGETTLPGVEYLFRDADSTETWFRVGSIPLRREAGQVEEALAIFQDIDAEKHLLDIQHKINARLEHRVREEMTAREAAQQRAAQAERLHALGQIAGGIAHDFNNILQAVSGGAALIERRPDDTERALRNARMILDASKRGAGITSRLLAFARRGDLRAESVDPASLLNDMAEVLTHTLGGSVICSVDVAPRTPQLFADRGQLETVLVNLATNGRDAMLSGGTLTLSAEAETVSGGMPHPAGLSPGRYVRIVVKDSGTGMDQAVLARVTEPFFTTKEPGKGTGLGLAMAKGFVEQSGGGLSIESILGHGTRVTLWLPGASGGASASQERVANRPCAMNDKPCILLVDNDAVVREVLTCSLEHSGYAVLSADSGAAAMGHLTAGQRVDILVSDLSLPVMDGLALIRSAQERRPKLPAVLLTGYTGDGAALAIGSTIRGTFSLLRKPVSGTQLVDRISALLVPSKHENNA